MAQEPDNIVPMLPREIRVAQDDHTRRFERVEKRSDDVHEGMVTSLGPATYARVRHEWPEKRVGDLAKRAERLEKSK